MNIECNNPTLHFLSYLRDIAHHRNSQSNTSIEPFFLPSNPHLNSTALPFPPMHQGTRHTDPGKKCTCTKKLAWCVSHLISLAGCTVQYPAVGDFCCFSFRSASASPLPLAPEASTVSRGPDPSLVVVQSNVHCSFKAGGS